MIYLSKKTTKQIDDKIIFKMLLIKLNGSEDICNSIISLKNEAELDTIRNYHIENDFYNWLNHDVLIRGDCSLENISLELKDYYNKNSGILGLKYYNGFVRTKSLSECYKSKWWKTTKKNYYSWCNIHYCINFDKIIKVYHGEAVLGHHFEGYDNSEIIRSLDCKELWRDPTIHEKQTIIKNYRDIIIYSNDINLLYTTHNSKRHKEGGEYLLVYINLVFI